MSDQKIVSTGITPYGIAVWHNKAFVCNSNNYGITGQDSVSVINIKNKNSTILNPFRIFSKTIYDVSFNQPLSATTHGGNIYITNSNSTTISIIDAKHNSVVGVIDGFDGACDLVVGKNDIAYVPNYGSGIDAGNGTTISIVNLLTNTLITPSITVDQAPTALAISKNRKRLYCISYVTGLASNGVLSAISTKTNTVLNKISGFFGPSGIAITNKYAIISNFGSNDFNPIGTTISIVTLHPLSIVKNIFVGLQPFSIALSSYARFCYVTCYNTLYSGGNFTGLTSGTGYVSVVDLKKLKVVKTIPVGDSPADIVVIRNEKNKKKKALVTNYMSNTLSIINL